jgi:hypothetical protein
MHGTSSPGTAEAARLASSASSRAEVFSPARVGKHLLVGFLRLEVGGGGIEGQQVYFQVQQVRDLEADLLLQLAALSTGGVLAEHFG